MRSLWLVPFLALGCVAEVIVGEPSERGPSGDDDASADWDRQSGDPPFGDDNATPGGDDGATPSDGDDGLGGDGAPPGGDGDGAGGDVPAGDGAGGDGPGDDGEDPAGDGAWLGDRGVGDAGDPLSGDDFTLSLTIEDFSATLDENPAAGLSLGTLVASTNGGTLTFSLADELPGGALDVDPATGELVVLDETLFDYETHPVITAMATADALGRTEQASITVTLVNAPEVWSQIGADMQGTEVFEQHGAAVSLSADGLVVAIGAPRNDAAGLDAGRATIFSSHTGSWVQIATIYGRRFNDKLGISTSTNADGSVVAFGARDGGGGRTGTVRVLANQGGSWAQIGPDIAGAALGDGFGTAVSLSSDGATIAIGGPGNNGTGHARVYQNSNGAWTQVGADIPGDATGDGFGTRVCLSGDASTVAVSAPWNSAVATWAGQVRVYENQDGTWVPVGTTLEGAAGWEYFGKSLSLSRDGSVLAVGAPDVGEGYVWVFHNDSGTWVQRGATLVGEVANDRFGDSLSLNTDGSVLAVGEPDNDSIGYASGRVRIYEDRAGSWVQLGSAIEAEAERNSEGAAVSLSANGLLVAVGAPDNDDANSNAGQVRVFEATE